MPYSHLTPLVLGVREGKEAVLLANELLPGDLVKFSVGDRVPADVRLLSAVELDIDESSLTGETRAVRKNTAAVQTTYGGAVPLGERTCVGFMGTLVRNGPSQPSFFLLAS